MSIVRTRIEAPSIIEENKMVYLMVSFDMFSRAFFT
jgi:hypothetical protein